MMIERENLENALQKITIQITAVVAVLSGGRAINGNAFDLNNLIEAKKNVESLLATLPKPSKK